MNAQPTGETPEVSRGRQRTRMVRPYPVHTLEDALAVATVIQESNAGLPFDRVLLAKAMATTPASSGFTMKLNSSAKYGLTQGGYNDDRISLTPLGQAIVAPKGGDERHDALVEAALRPDVFGRFYRMLAGKRLPEDEYAKNVLVRELGVRTDLTRECLGIVKSNGEHVGILRDREGALYVQLPVEQVPPRKEQHEGPGEPARSPAARAREEHEWGEAVQIGGRIFIGHCGNPKAVEFVQAVLDDFGIPFSIAEEDGDAPWRGRPIPAGVSAQMRACSAAILVFGNDDGVEPDTGAQAVRKMLYQLGAASMLYGDRVVVVEGLGSARLGGSDDLAGLRCLPFGDDKPEEAAMALMRELHRAGVISVTV